MTTISKFGAAFGKPTQTLYLHRRRTVIAALMCCVVGVGSPVVSSASSKPTGEQLRLVCGNGLCYYHGNTFQLGTLTLGDLKSYCAGVSVDSRAWHLGYEAELKPALPFFAHGKGVWSDFSHIDVWGPGYILVTGNASGSPRSNSDVAVTVDVYRLYGNTANAQLSYLGLGAINPEGPSIDTAPLTDGSGNVAAVKVICVTKML